MDSSTPDPQPQPQPQMQQPPRPQPQHQPHQPKPQQQQQQLQPQQPQQHPQQHQHSHQQHPPIPAGAYRPVQHHHATSYPYQYAHQPQMHAFQAQPYHGHYTYYPGPYMAPNPPAANFNSGMVQPPQQTNVPQPHAKQAPQIMNPVINADQTHQSTLQSVTITNQSVAPVPPTREKRPAIMRRPDTKEIVPLEPLTTTATATTTTITTTTTTTNTIDKTSSATSTTTASATAVPATVAAAATPATTLLATSNDEKKKVDIKKPDESSPAKNVQAKQNPAQALLQKASEDGVVELEIKAPQLNKNSGQESIKKVEIEKVEPTKVKEQEDGNHKQEEDEEKEEKEEEEKKMNGNDDSGGSIDDSNNKNDQETDSKVELHYEPGQYNPISNRTGRKVYSREFMLEVCEKICKLDLSHKESDDKIGIESSRLQNAFSEKVDLFAPSFSSNQRYTPTNRQNEPARRQSQHNYAGRSSAGQDRQRKVITSVSLTQEVELKTTSNPWRPTKEIKEDVPTDEVETEVLKKKFRSILNKLTPNNFENLAHAVTDLHIDTESKLGEVIDIVFAKALAEPGYCVLYGQMCSHLKKITAGQANFGNTLLKRCQHQFQSDIYSGLNLEERREKIDKEEDPEVKKQLNEELYEDMYRCRMKGLGLIKFIGELYKIEMLNDTIMFDCVLRLLGDTSEESLECLCDLLTTIGEKLDRSSKGNAEKEKKAPQKSAPKANAYAAGQKSAAAVLASGSTSSQAQQKAALEQQGNLTTLDQVFDQLHKIRKNKDLPLSVRIRFKLLDTCELREKDNWLSKKTKDNNPKKIEEIREAHKEKLEQERRQQSAMGPRRSQEGRRGLGHSGGSSNQISSMANESSGNRGQSNMHTSSSSHLLRDHSMGDNMKSNHNDIESQKEHQKKIENLKKFSSTISSSTISSSSSTEPLRPQLFKVRPLTTGLGAGSLRPNSTAATSTAPAPATTPSTTATNTTDTSASTADQK